MKILHIIGHAHGGAGQHVLSLARRCDPNRFESTVALADDNPMRGNFERAGVRVSIIETSRCGRVRKHAAHYRQLAALLKREVFDVIETHTMVPSILGRIAARRHTHTPVVHMLHAFAGQRFRTRAAREAARRIEQRMDRYTDWYIAGSQAMVERGIAHRVFAADKVVLISNGVDLQSFADEASPSSQNAASASKDEQSTVVVGFLGRLDGQKGVEHLIRAAAIVRRVDPRIRFRLAGDGPLRARLESLVAQLQLGDIVEFLGWQSDRIAFLKGIDFLAMPSIWEAFGLSAAEAMALEKPVVASRIEGLPEVVGDAGLLVAPTDHEALAQAIVELAADPARRRELGRQARARILERFTLDLMISRHEEFYERVHALGARRAPASSQLANSTPRMTTLPTPAYASAIKPHSDSVNDLRAEAIT